MHFCCFILFINIGVVLSEINNIDLYQQIHIDTTNIQSQQGSNEITTYKSEALVQEAPEANFATITEISKQALADINKVISKEDLIVTELNNTNEIFNSLSTVRKQLENLIQDLKNTNKYDNIEILKELDKKTNDIIIDIEKLLKKEEKNGLVDFNYTNIFLNGLTSIRKLDISDDNYLTNLENIMSLVINKENSYKNLTNENLNKTTLVSKEYDSLLKTSERTQDNSSNKLQKGIVLNINETLKSVTNGLTTDVVLRLLNQ